MAEIRQLGQAAAIAAGGGSLDNLLPDPLPAFLGVAVVLAGDLLRRFLFPDLETERAHPPATPG